MIFKTNMGVYIKLFVILLLFQHNKYKIHLIIIENGRKLLSLN